MKNANVCAAWTASLLLAAGSAVTAEAAAFTYHGQLTDAGAAANGAYDLRLTVYGSAQGDHAIAPAVTLFGVAVRDGSFSTELDLGDGAARGGWVGVDVRPAGAGDFEALAGRTPMEPAGACPASWSLDGNAGTTAGTNYLGTADAVDLSIKAGGTDVANFSASNRAVILTPFGGAALPGAGSTSVSLSNGAAGNYSFAGGFTASTVNQGSFVWGDTSAGNISDSAANQFVVKAAGGVILNGNTLSLSSDDLVVYPRADGDADADLRLVSRNGLTAIAYLEDATGILHIAANGGVDIENPVAIDGALDAKALAIEGRASKSTAGAWAANSDARIKQDIEPIGAALDTLARLHPVTFRYTDGYRADHAGVGAQRYYNVIAQEFAEVFPDAVTGSGEYLAGAPKTADNEILQVDTYPAQIVTIAAVQELAERNTRLEADVAGQRATIDRLSARLARLESSRRQ